jgi:hypothetical protein
MGLFKTKAAIAGISTILIATASLFADAVVDKALDDNQNEFEYYWYYFDDNAGMGNNDRPQAAKTSKASVIDVKYTEEARAFRGDAADTWKVKVYKFTRQTEGTNSFATMPFTFGDVFETPDGWDMNPFVGIGTMLQADGKYIDLTGVEKVKFKIKSRKKDLTVRFKVQTYEIDSISSGNAAELKAMEATTNPFGYYGKWDITATAGAFTEVEVAISGGTKGQGDLTPPTWAKKALPYNIKRVTKLAWEINLEDNSEVTSDTLDIDDIEFIGTYKFVSPFIWPQTVPMSPLPATGQFATFDKKPYNETPWKGDYSGLKNYWYAYDDGAIKGTSAVNSGATKNATTGLLDLKFEAGSGANEQGQGMLLGFTLGDPVQKTEEVEVKGFVGYGCNVYDSTNSAYLDAKAAKADKIFFQYATDGDVPFISLEVSDSMEVADAKNPTRRDHRGDGIVWFRNFPSTAGKWVAVEFPLDSLKIHSDWEGAKDTPLIKTALAKLQWKVQGAKGKSGTFAVDNVYFPGVSKDILPENTGSAIINGKTVKQASFSTAFANGNIHVTVGKALTNGTVSLFSSNGTRIAVQPVGFKTTFAANNLPAGMYVVKVSAVDFNGKAVAMQSPVTIVK